MPYDEHNVKSALGQMRLDIRQAPFDRRDLVVQLERWDGNKWVAIRGRIDRGREIVNHPSWFNARAYFRTMMIEHFSQGDGTLGMPGDPSYEWLWNKEDTFLHPWLKEEPWLWMDKWQRRFERKRS